MFLFAFMFGVLGAGAHCLYIFTGAVAGKVPDFTIRRLGWYGPQPLLGGILGGLLYVVIRGGLLSTSSGASAVSLFGVAAIGAVAGLSVSRAYKLLLDTSPAKAPPQQNNADVTAGHAAAAGDAANAAAGHAAVAVDAANVAAGHAAVAADAANVAAGHAVAAGDAANDAASNAAVAVDAANAAVGDAANGVAGPAPGNAPPGDEE